MWSAPDPTSTMMARPLPESPVGCGEPGGAGPPGQRAASVLVSNSLHAWERCTCQAGKSFAVVSAQPTASRSCGGVTRAHGQALAAPGSAPARLHRPQQSGQLRHHPTTKMWSWRWRSGRRRGAAPLPVCPFESSCRSCTVTQDPWVRAEGAVRGGPRRRRAHGAGPYFSVSGFRLYPLRSL